MKDYTKLLKQVEEAAREIREAMAEKPKGVIARPGMVMQAVFPISGIKYRLVLSRLAHRRFGGSCGVEYIPSAEILGGNEFNPTHGSYGNYTTLDGQPIIGYEDDV